MPIVRPGTLENEKIVIEETSFNYPGSDIALRSCDSRDFPLPKLYILICSPVLGDLIRRVSTTSDIPNGVVPEPLPVVKLPESGATLYHLLTFIFPVDPVLPSTPEKIMELLAVAQKYQMKSVSSHIRGVIARKDPPFICPETAHGIYFLAQMYGVHEEAIQAARVTLRLPMIIRNVVDKLDFPGLTGAYLHELWKYHQRVRSDLKSGLPEFRKSGLPHDVKHLRCKILESEPSTFNECPSLPPLSPALLPLTWLDKYIESIANEPHRFDPVAFENDWTRHVKETTAKYSKPCSCMDLPSEIRRGFWKALTTFVRTTIEKVRAAGATRHRRSN